MGRLLHKFTKGKKKFKELMRQFWCPGAAKVIQAKLADKTAYDSGIREAGPYSTDCGSSTN